MQHAAEWLDGKDHQLMAAIIEDDWTLVPDVARQSLWSHESVRWSQFGTLWQQTVGLTPMKRRKVPGILCSSSNNMQMTGNWQREKEQPEVVRIRPFRNQPSMAELEADVSVDA